ncbi:MAG: tRNA (N6-isopentenyl adenosine(37)-C2)-methylthiotransferase MiaB [Spirochaetales bacterium]|nr:tRNA (N6-isopentenyl adenosine(37)-C2)-methylthiotransferase MiaB [Spirochaetales bacterium]
MNYLIETYGCQMNKAESSALETTLADRGWSRVNDYVQADVVLINTCSVRITAENRAWGRIAHYAALKKQKSFVLIVTGCMAERLHDSMREKAPGVDYVLGNFQKSSFGVLLDAIEAGIRLETIEETPEYIFAPSHLEPGAFTAFVPIMHGCNNFCTYCIVPYVRGREISRDPDAIDAELASFAEAGVREVTLLGQNVNSYHWTDSEDDLDFSKLLARVAKTARSAGISRLRFVSSHPKDLSNDTIRVMAADDIFARHIHLCVQHGSDRILAAMNRGYTSDDYRNLADRIRTSIPGVTLSTDILVGFPGETEEDIDATLELMRTIGFAYAFMYYYNPREGTPAATYADQVPERVKKERLARVIALQRQITRDMMRGMLGATVDVLVEDVSKKSPEEVLARSDQDMMVVFNAGPERVGSFARVRLVSVRGNTFKAEEVF